jgi:mannose-1-phosphate guanylyltransferase
VVSDGAAVRRSVLGFGAFVGAQAVLEDVVVGDRARIGAHVELLAGARVWPDVVVPDGAIRFSADL